jgi:hypothetical protein
VIYLTEMKLVLLIFVGFEKKLSGFDQLLAKCSVFKFLFGAEHCQSLEIALTNFGLHYLKVDLSHIEFYKDVAF